MRRVRGQLDKFGFELLPPRDCESSLPPPSPLDVVHLAAPGGGRGGLFRDGGDER